MAHPCSVCYGGRPVLRDAGAGFDSRGFHWLLRCRRAGRCGGYGSCLHRTCLAGWLCRPACRQAQRCKLCRAFGRFAVAAAVGLLGVTRLALARPLVDIHPALLLGSVAVLAAELRGVQPIILMAVATLVGGLTGFYNL